MEKLSKIVRNVRIVKIMRMLVVMPAVMAGMAFLFSGCGTAAPRALTEEEIAVFNTEFFNDETSNMNNMLLAGEYNRPEEIDLLQLFYNGIRQGTSEISDEELATNFTWCTVTAGTWETDDKLTLEYTKEYVEGQWAATLQKKGDSYLFVSNLRTL